MSEEGCAGTPGTICSPIPQRRHKYIISFHGEDPRGMVVRGQEIKQNPQNTKEKPPNLISNGMEKAGLGYGRQRGRGGTREA